MSTQPSTGSVWTPSKKLVRERVDALLIASLFSELGHGLRYFGLPAADGEDIRAWSQYIESVMAVDYDPEALRSLSRTLLIHHPNITVYERLGRIEDLILDGNTDNNGEKLWNEWDDNAKVWRWAFDLVNFDAYRAFLHDRTSILGKNAAYYARAEAIRKLFERQRGQRFVFFLTVPLVISSATRTNDFRSDILRYLEEQQKILVPPYAEAIDQRMTEKFGYPGTPQLITAVPLLLAGYASEQSFQMSQCVTLTYRGNKNAPMLHVACYFTPTGSALPTGPDAYCALSAPYLEVRVRSSNPQLLLGEHQTTLLDETSVRQRLAQLDITLDD